jgi:glycosyltransferase involved in cell wall biosynthesis
MTEAGTADRSDGPYVSVVMPMLNAAEHVGAALKSLAGQQWSGRWELVVADNGSTDESVEIVRGYRPSVPRLVIADASRLRARAHACNVGARAASGSALLFVDSDDALAPDYISAMAGALREHPLVCGRLEVDSLNPYWTRAMRPSPQFDGPGSFHDFLPQAFGASLGMRRALFESLGGFDESIRWTEDRDLCWRAQLDAGASIVFVPDAVVHYRYRQTLRGIFTQARNWSREERLMRRRYEPRGMPPGSRHPIIRGLWGLMKHARRLPHPAGRAFWFKRLGHVIGGTEGRLRRRPWV